MDAFDAMWDKLAKQSRCDARGSAEYTRVRREWELYVKIQAVDFILTRANVVPAPVVDLPQPKEGGA